MAGEVRVVAMNAGRVRQIMRRDFIHAPPDESLTSARQTMRLGRLRHLLVTRDEMLLGVLSYRDVLDWITSAEPGAYERARVAEIMSSAPTCITPDATLLEAADRICRYRLGCLPVVNAEHRLVGVITEVDLLSAAYGLSH